MFPIWMQKINPGRSKRSVFAALPIGWAVTAIYGCAAFSSELENEPANIILFIGDGMRGQHRPAAQWASVGQNGRLAMDDLQYLGAVRTGSANQAVNDSAAAATAMAKGIKTGNDVTGLDTESNEVQTIT